MFLLIKSSLKKRSKTTTIPFCLFSNFPSNKSYKWNVQVRLKWPLWACYWKSSLVKCYKLKLRTRESNEKNPKSDILLDDWTIKRRYPTTIRVVLRKKESRQKLVKTVFLTFLKLFFLRRGLIRLKEIWGILYYFKIFKFSWTSWKWINSFIIIILKFSLKKRLKSP